MHRQPAGFHRAPYAVQSHNHRSGSRTYYRLSCDIPLFCCPLHTRRDGLHPGLLQGSGLHRLFCRGQVQVQMPLLLPGSGSLRSGSLHPAAPAPEQRIHF